MDAGQKTTFLPSEVARLVLGYLKEQLCAKAFECFLRDSIHLGEYRSMLDQGFEAPLTIGGRTLVEVLCLCQLDARSSGEVKDRAELWTKLDHIVTQLKSFSASVDPDVESDQPLPTRSKLSRPVRIRQSGILATVRKRDDTEGSSKPRSKAASSKTLSMSLDKALVGSSSRVKKHVRWSLPVEALSPVLEGVDESHSTVRVTSKVQASSAENASADQGTTGDIISADNIARDEPISEVTVADSSGDSVGAGSSLIIAESTDADAGRQTKQAALRLPGEQYDWSPYKTMSKGADMEETERTDIDQEVSDLLNDLFPMRNVVEKLVEDDAWAQDMARSINERKDSQSHIAEEKVPQVLDITKSDPTFSDFHSLLEDGSKRKKGKPVKKSASFHNIAPPVSPVLSQQSTHPVQQQYSVAMLPAPTQDTDSTKPTKHNQKMYRYETFESEGHQQTVMRMTQEITHRQLYNSDSTKSVKGSRTSATASQPAKSRVIAASSSNATSRSKHRSRKQQMTGMVVRVETPTESADLSQPVSTRSADLTQLVSTRSADLSQAVSTTGADLSQAVSTTGADLSQAVSTRSADLSQAAPTQSADLSQPTVQILPNIGTLLSPSSMYMVLAPANTAPQMSYTQQPSLLALPLQSPSLSSPNNQFVTNTQPLQTLKPPATQHFSTGLQTAVQPTSQPPTQPTWYVPNSQSIASIVEALPELLTTSQSSSLLVTPSKDIANMDMEQTASFLFSGTSPAAKRKHGRRSQSAVRAASDKQRKGSLDNLTQRGGANAVTSKWSPALKNLVEVCSPVKPAHKRTTHVRHLRFSPKSVKAKRSPMRKSPAQSCSPAVESPGSNCSALRIESPGTPAEPPSDLPLHWLSQASPHLSKASPQLSKASPQVWSSPAQAYMARSAADCSRYQMTAVSTPPSVGEAPFPLTPTTCMSSPFAYDRLCSTPLPSPLARDPTMLSPSSTIQSPSMYALRRSPRTSTKTAASVTRLPRRVVPVARKGGPSISSRVTPSKKNSPSIVMAGKRGSITSITVAQSTPKGKNCIPTEISRSDMRKALDAMLEQESNDPYPRLTSEEIVEASGIATRPEERASGSSDSDSDETVGVAQALMELASSESPMKTPSKYFDQDSGSQPPSEGSLSPSRGESTSSPQGKKRRASPYIKQAKKRRKSPRRTLKGMNIQSMLDMIHK